MYKIEDYVSFETAKLLKKKGFPQDFTKVETIYPTRGNCRKRLCRYNMFIPERDRSSIAAPTLWYIQNWLRTEKGIFIEITPSAEFDRFYYKIWKKNSVGSSKLFYDSMKDDINGEYKSIIESAINKAFKI